MEAPKKDVCTMRIMFPIDSDEEAISYKKKIEEALADKSEANIQFIIAGMPQGR